MHDLTVPGQQAVVVEGGSGGRGNRRFSSSTRQAPRFAERGLDGGERWIDLRLKLLADVGLVGVPNAGKSSLISVMTRAAPKIAGYPFTTLEPVLGTLEGPERQLIIADIPGLIEGASEGAGLGHEFLAHVERTRMLVHVLDLAPLDGSDPEANFATIERELELHDARLARLPRILALSKADLVTEARGADRARGVGRAAGRGRAGARDLLGDAPGARRAGDRAVPARAGAGGGAGRAGRGRRRAGRAPRVPAGVAPRLPRRARRGRAVPAWRATPSTG